MSEYKPYVPDDTPLRDWSLRGLFLGIIFGAVLGSANAYIGLQVGLTISTSIPLAVIMVAAFATLRPVIGKGSILDVNIGQTAGSASSSLASGIIFTIPALFMWGLAPTLGRGWIQVAMLAMCGGVLGIGNPQSGALSPFNVLGLFLNPVHQFKVELLLHILIMPIGFIMLTRSLKIPTPTALFGSVLWAGNGFLAFRLLHGQTTFFGLLLAPILLALMIEEIGEIEVEILTAPTCRRRRSTPSSGKQTACSTCFRPISIK